MVQNILERSNIINISILLSFILFLFFSNFEYFSTPRFWAEEGNVYFYNAFTYGISSLFMEQQGYYSIVPNISTYLATLVPLEYAPLVTTTISFIVQVIPFYLIYTSKSIFFNTPLKKISASCIIFFTAYTDEIVLNTINSQFHFVIILFLILVDNYKGITDFKKLFISFLVLFAGLSGVPANILAPFFLLKYFFEKNTLFIYYFIILCFTISIQLLVILNTESILRLENFNIIDFLNRLYLYSIYWPFFSSNIQEYYLLTLPIFYYFYLSLKDHDLFFFFVSSFFISTILLIGSLLMMGGGRYAYAPSVILVLGLQVYVVKFPNDIRKLIAFIFLICSVSFGIYNFSTQRYDTTNWIKWKDQVELYENYKSDFLVLYPQGAKNYWAVSLKPIIYKESKLLNKVYTQQLFQTIFVNKNYEDTVLKSSNLHWNFLTQDHLMQFYGWSFKNHEHMKKLFFLKGSKVNYAFLATPQNISGISLLYNEKNLDKQGYKLSINKNSINPDKYEVYSFLIDKNGKIYTNSLSPLLTLRR